MEPLRAGDPHRVGPYRVLARLGAGGMGVVYLGRSRSGRAAAVKVIRRNMAADPEYRARFRREVEAARKVIGTFTAPVLDADPEAAWLATAYLPGLTLREAVGAFGPMAPDVVRPLAAGLAEALAAIHRAGVVHRDLKPANVILTAGGPRVIDFGIARPAGGGAITQAGMPIGTPGFMSPEQMSADEDVGPASDIFTLGAVLAYAATGVEPFGTGSMLSRQYRVMTVQSDLSGIDEDWLRELVVACLRRDPGRRPSATEILGRLGEPGAAGVSLQGTRWLPPPVAEEIDRRTAQAPRPAPGERRVADEALPDLVTAESSAVPPRDPPRVGRRTAIAGAAAGVLAAGGLSTLLWNREPDRSPGATPAPSPSRPRPSPTPTGPPPRAVRRWRVKVGDYYPDLFLAGNVVLVRGEADDTYAIDSRTGRILWRREIALAAVSDGIAFLTSPVPPHMTAVRPASGKTRWTYEASFGSFAVHAAATGSVACVGGPGNRHLVALGALDGRVRWSSAVGITKRSVNGFAAGAGMVAVVNADLVGLRARDGRRRWRYPIDEGVSVWFGAGRFFVEDTRFTLHALRADDGTLAWRRPETGWLALLPVGGGLVYVSEGDGTVLALRAAGGETVGSRRLGEGAPYGQGNALGLSGGMLYVGCTDRNVYALDSATGRIQWAYPADVTLRSGPVSAGGLVFVGTRDGYVNALAAPGLAGG